MRRSLKGMINKGNKIMGAIEGPRDQRRREKENYYRGTFPCISQLCCALTFVSLEPLLPSDRDPRPIFPLPIPEPLLLSIRARRAA